MTSDNILRWSCGEPALPHAKRTRPKKGPPRRAGTYVPRTPAVAGARL